MHSFAQPMRTLHSVTIFLAACLLFLLEPLVAKSLLPLLGGAPAVWTTCLVFFQGALLAGYAWAHFSVKHLGVRRQAVLQLVVLALPLVVLPFDLAGSSVSAWPTAESPVGRILGLLVASVGLPFFAVSATSPLVQRYFAEHRDAAAKDPYFLYSASNVGSFAGLVLYPFVVERSLGLAAQARYWRVGYVVFACLMAACIVASLRQRPLAADAGPAEEAPRIALARKLRWLLLAAVPSSLLSGVTNFLTTDIAPVPLLWMLPLGVYLATFINAFAKKPLVSTRIANRLFPMGVLFVLLFWVFNSVNMPKTIGVIHVVTFALASLVAHGRLAEDRPDARNLTQFFLWVSAGGVIGSSFNALLAPMLFNDFIEYRLVLVAAVFLRTVKWEGDEERGARRDDVVHPLASTVVACALAFLAPPSVSLAVRMCLGTALALFIYRRHDRTLRLALGVTGFLLAGTVLRERASPSVFRDRNFFGVLSVAYDEAKTRRYLSSGTTIHGAQDVASESAHVPSTYYSRPGPLGDVFRAFSARPAEAQRVAVVGLGTGTIASYARPGEAWDFFEINPVDVRVATSAGLFTYLSDSFAGSHATRVVLGDARIKLRDEPKSSYDMIILDAFNSDAIPVHLLDREAFALYGERLRPNGWIVAHVSNRFLDLSKIVAALGKDAGRDVRCRKQGTISKESFEQGALCSTWCVVAPSEESLRILAPAEEWTTPVPTTDRLWTDDFSDLLGAMLSTHRT